jgi:hypothetical protein
LLHLIRDGDFWNFGGILDFGDLNIATVIDYSLQHKGIEVSGSDNRARVGLLRNMTNHRSERRRVDRNRACFLRTVAELRGRQLFVLLGILLPLTRIPRQVFAAKIPAWGAMSVP